MKLTAPRTIKKPYTRRKHNIEWQDDYAWLEDRDNPATLKHLRAENAYTDSCLEDTKQLQATLFEEIKNRIQLEDVSVSSPYKDYLYYYRTKSKDEYAAICRRPRSGGAEEVILDENILADGHEYFELGSWDMSPDQQHIVFSIDTIGDENYNIYILDLHTGQWLIDRISSTAAPVVWDATGKSFFYLRFDTSMRPYRVMRHVMGTFAANDQQVFLESNPHYSVDIGRSISDEYIFIGCNANNSSEYHFIPAAQPDRKPQLMLPRQTEVEYYPEHQGEYFLLLTNRTRKNFALTKINIIDIALREEIPVYTPQAEDIYLDDFTVTHKVIAVVEDHNAQSTLKILAAMGKEQIITMQDPCYSLELLEDHEYLSADLRYHYESLTTPSSIYSLNCPSQQVTLLKREVVLGSFNPEDYQSERLWVTGKDGARIPMSVVYKKTTALDGSAACYLYGYGAYGLSTAPSFSYARLSLLDRGFVYAIAHVRGGAELGEDWYHAGKLEHKMNSFHDFIACGEYLIANHYTKNTGLIAYGASAGGLLVAASVNMRPDLFKLAILEVPFVDCLNTMLNPDLPLTVGEYDEWGDPNDVAAFQRIRAYSPCDNIKAQAYPHMLVVASLHDTHVQYWEPVKWVAKLREHSNSSAEFLLKMHMDAGHGGVSGRFAAMKDIAFEFAYILKYYEKPSKKGI